MKKTKFFEEWGNLIKYSEPHINDSNDKWDKFVKKATYSRVVKVLKKNSHGDVLFVRDKVASLFLRRLSRGNWPKFTQSFVDFHSDIILKVKSYETAKSEVKGRFKGKRVRFLIDKNNQMLGIALDRDTIVTGFVTEAVGCELAIKLFEDEKLISKDKLMHVSKYILGINKLLADIDCLEMPDCYWVCSGQEVHKSFSLMSYLAVDKGDLACLLFLM